MSYLGQVELKSSEIRRVNVTGSTSATHTLTWTPPSEQSLIITINGIKQQNNYTISGVTLTLDTALIATDAMEVVGILDIGEAVTPPDDSISTAKIQDDAVTADKLANSINTEITANTAKVTNATHTGDVTGATALTIAADAVDIAMLSATGVASATTFLRGDNAWAEAGGGKVLQVVTATKVDAFTTTSTTYVDLTGLSVSITPASSSNKVLVTMSVGYAQTQPVGFPSFTIDRSGTDILTGTSGGSTNGLASVYGVADGSSMSIGGAVCSSVLDSPSSTSALTYKIQCMTTAQTLYVNRYSGNTNHGFASTIIAMEIEG